MARIRISTALRDCRCKGVKALCGVCRNPFVRTSLQRVGHRLLCGSCFNSELWRETGEGAPPPPLKPLDLKSLRRLSAVLLLLGLAAKAAVFIGFFLWASESAVGDAALRGVVCGDLFTWIIFSALDFHFRKLRITVGAVFEIVLLMVFLNREALLSVPTAPAAMAMTVGAFFGFVLLKSAVWGAEHAIQASGVKETA